MSGLAPAPTMRLRAQRTDYCPFVLASRLRARPLIGLGLMLAGSVSLRLVAGRVTAEDVGRVLLLGLQIAALGRVLRRDLVARHLILAASGFAECGESFALLIGRLRHVFSSWISEPATRRQPGCSCDRAQ